jgi:hypothetical protein
LRPRSYVDETGPDRLAGGEDVYTNERVKRN